MDLLKALRDGTADAHRALESEIDFLNSSLTLDTYVQTLRIFQAFVSAWEELAARDCPEGLVDFYNDRRRAPLLKADLAFFEGGHADQKPREPSPELPDPVLPNIETHSSFFGAWYVMEGSTLGGQVIARHLESSLELSDGKGYRYFRGHGSYTGRMWKEFLDLLRQESPSLNEAEVVTSARAMFDSFRCFYAEQKPHTN